MTTLGAAVGTVPLGCTQMVRNQKGHIHRKPLKNYGPRLKPGSPDPRLEKLLSLGPWKSTLSLRPDLLVPHLIHTKPHLKLRFENVWAGTYSTFAKVVGKDDIYVFGLNDYNQLGVNSLMPQYHPIISPKFSGHKWRAISCAPHHALAVNEEGRTFVIGRKEYGRLGLGADSEDATELTEIPALNKKKVISIGCGTANSFAVTDEGVLYGWGMGSMGQLGTGGEDDCSEPTIIKSKQLADRKVFRVSAGDQHTVILAMSDNNNHKLIDK